jgi:short-subunit dehydrogenase
MDYRNALITGASSGIGRHLTVWFANRGVRVYAAGRRTEKLKALKLEAKGNVEPVELDVTDPKETIARIQQLDRESGGLDLVIANAGVGEESHAAKIDWSKIQQMIDVNVTGAAATLTAALPGMIERKRGHLVGISSVAAARGMPRTAAYSATKAFLSTFLEGLRVDLVGSGVEVTSIHPGFVKSEMTDKNKFKMPFILETEDAAQMIGKAILRTDSAYVFPWQMSLLYTSLRAMPNKVFDRAMHNAWGRIRGKQAPRT